MDIYALIGLILVMAVVCSLFEINDKFMKLLYVLGAVLVVIVVMGLFGISFGGHLQVSH